MKPCLLVLLLVPAFLSAPAPLAAEPLYSPAWGFFLDLPEGYEYTEGNGSDRFSFQNPYGAVVSIAVYHNLHQNIDQMSQDIQRRLGNEGEIAFFDYGGKAAALMELSFMQYTGWGLCMELGAPDGGGAAFLVALAYAQTDANLYHFSALDSLAPAEADRRRPGPITEFAYPRGQRVEAPIAGTALKTLIGEHDAEAAQALIEREFALMRRYEKSPNWQEAWARYYRAIYRDSRDRIADAAARLAQSWSDGDRRPLAARPEAARAFAGKALSFVQAFPYERDLSGSDFVNLVSAVTEGRGDCDSRAMLWAIILMQADIPAAMMVSRDYSHAMGLADIAGSGARFEAGGVKWLVAETTGQVGIGLIDQAVSNSDLWLGVLFE